MVRIRSGLFPPTRGGVDIVVVAARSFGMLVGGNDNDGTGHRYLSARDVENVCDAYCGDVCLR